MQVVEVKLLFIYLFIQKSGVEQQRKLLVTTNPNIVFQYMTIKTVLNYNIL